MVQIICIKFHHEFYQSAINKVSFDLPHFKLLGKNYVGKNLSEALEIRSHSKNTRCRRDYAEKLVT